MFALWRSLCSDLLLLLPILTTGCFCEIPYATSELKAILLRVDQDRLEDWIMRWHIYVTSYGLYVKGERMNLPEFQLSDHLAMKKKFHRDPFEYFQDI